MIAKKIKFILTATVVVGSFLFGWNTNGWRLNKQISEIKREQAEKANEVAKSILVIERINREKAEAIAARAAAEQKSQEIRATTIREEVLVYVQDPSTGTCDIPDSWVQSHDSAATGMPRATETTRSPDAVPERTITDRDALVAVTENYNTCRQNAIRHKTLIDWARSMTDISRDK